MNDNENNLMNIMKYIQKDTEVYEKNWDSVFEEETDDFNIVEEKFKLPSKRYNYEKMLTGVMEHLEQVGGVEFAVLKDPELGRFWSAKVKDREEKRKFKEAKEKLYSTMTKEELKILGIKQK